MSYEAKVGSDIGTLKSTADMSLKQYRFVKGGAADGEVVVAAAATDLLLGVLQNTPAAAEAAQLQVVGISKILCGGVVTRFSRLTSDANGKAIVAVGAQVVGAIALQAGVDGDIISALVIAGADDFLSLAVAATVAGVKIARGQHQQAAASDTVVTGLATVVACGASFRDNPTVKQLFVACSEGDQAGAPAAGSILTKTFKPTAVNDVTPLAATDFTDNIKLNWWAIGT